jgi:4-amino-4-deoxy-L-arabinose transferase-like glycosyltransferase
VFSRLVARPALLLGLVAIVILLAAELAVLRVGIDDLDEGYFVQQGARVLAGQLPYRDFATLYTPGLVYLHAALFWALGGPYVIAPRALALLTRAALALLLFVMARPLVRNPLWAAAPSVFLLLALDDAPVRWEPHPGWLSTLFAVLAAWCLSHTPSTRWLVASGLAAGASYLFKQNTGVFIIAAIVAGSVLITRDAQPRKKQLVIPVVAFAGLTAVWLIPLLVAIHGQVALLAGFVGAVDQAGLLSPPEPSILVPLACLVGGLWLARRCADGPLRWYLLAGTAIFCTQYPRMDTLHLAWSAPVLLVVGAVVMDRVRPAVAGLIALGLIGLSWPVLSSRLDVLTDPSPRVPISAEVRYAAGLEVPQATATDLQGVVADIQGRTRPGEPIFVYPTSPLLYVLAERPNPTPFDHLNPGAATPAQIQGVIADIEAANVGLVVVSDFWQAVWGPPGANAPLETWLSSHFVEVARDGAYRVLASGL